MSDDARHIVAAIIAAASGGVEGTRERLIEEYEKTLEALKARRPQAPAEEGIGAPVQVGAGPRREI